MGIYIQTMQVGRKKKKDVNAWLNFFCKLSEPLKYFMYGSKENVLFYFCVKLKLTFFSLLMDIFLRFSTYLHFCLSPFFLFLFFFSFEYFLLDRIFYKTTVIKHFLVKQKTSYPFHFLPHSRHHHHYFLLSDIFYTLCINQAYQL